MTRYLQAVVLILFIFITVLPVRVSAATIKPYSAILGNNCTTTGTYSTAMGSNNEATGMFSTAMGALTEASGESSTSMGYETTASGKYSTALGQSTTASGQGSVAMGGSTEASGTGAFVVGYVSVASGYLANAMGNDLTASGEHSTMIGKGYNNSHKLVNNIDQSFMVGYMSSDSDTTPELFVKDKAVGINTTSPATMLHVTRNISAGAGPENHVAIIENTSTSTSPDVLMVKVNNDNPTDACNFITFRDVDNNVGAIEGNGTGGVVLTSTSSDFAEHLPKADPREAMNPGDIVGLFSGGLSKTTKDAQRLMVITTSPAVLGNRPQEEEALSYAPVAFLGQVPVKTLGPVQAGDYILPSGNGDGTGVAVSPKTISPSQYSVVVGRSLESNMVEGLKAVNVLVGLPQNGLWDGLVKQKDTRISELEDRLVALEAKVSSPMNAGVGVLFGALGFLWVDRRRSKRPVLDKVLPET